MSRNNKKSQSSVRSEVTNQAGSTPSPTGGETKYPKWRGAFDKVKSGEVTAREFAFRRVDLALQKLPEMMGALSLEDLPDSAWLAEEMDILEEKVNSWVVNKPPTDLQIEKFRNSCAKVARGAVKRANEDM